MNQCKVSVVLPVYNEEDCIERLLKEIEMNINYPVELVLVDDGSTDRTLNTLKGYKIQKSDNTKKVVVLSRNFGHQLALMAGLSNVSDESKLIVVMDSDFQDAPKDIPLLLKKIEEGYDCVYAVRKSRPDNSILGILSAIFHKMQTRISSFYIPPNVGTFSVFTKRVLDKILMFKETDIYFPGLRAYVGYEQAGVNVKRRERAHGKSRVGISGLMSLSLVALINFSGIPMRVVFFSGLSLTIFCVIIGCIFFVLKVIGVINVPGLTTTLILMMGMFGIQIMFTGILGEYIGRLLRESKERPRWVIKEMIDE
jgi:polyisoprenyl-phosphate glycosyltransferase